MNSLCVFIARTIDSLLSREETLTLGKTFLARVIKESKKSEFASQIRRAFNALQKERAVMGYNEELIDALSSLDENVRDAALESLMGLGPEIGMGPDIGYYAEIGMGPEIGFSLKSFTKKIKKATSSIKKAGAAIKKIKKHDFKKDISALNKVGKVVGPIAASAPPPYGPAIAGGLMVLDAADKYNKGAIDKIDVSKALKAAGVEEAEGIQDIMKVAQNVRNNIKATGLIEAVNRGDQQATVKLQTIKTQALQGNVVAKDALSAVKSAQAGRKLEPETKAQLVQKAAPKEPQTQAVIQASHTVTMPSGKTVSIVNRNAHGAALIIQMAR